jgi:hypothetical protein
MPEDLPVTKRINVMVGITRSKVIICHTLHVVGNAKPGKIVDMNLKYSDNSNTNK